MGLPSSGCRRRVGFLEVRVPNLWVLRPDYFCSVLRIFKPVRGGASPLAMGHCLRADLNLNGSMVELANMGAKAGLCEHVRGTLKRSIQLLQIQ